MLATPVSFPIKGLPKTTYFFLWVGLEGAYDLGPFIRNEVGVVDIPFLRLPNLVLPRLLTIKRKSFCS